MATIDPMAESLLSVASEAVQKMETLSADLELRMSGTVSSTSRVWELKQTISLRFMRPNYAYIERHVFDPGADSNSWNYLGQFSTFISDGSHSWVIHHKEKTFEKWQLDADGVNIRGINTTSPFVDFFDKDRSFHSRFLRGINEGDVQSLSYVGQEMKDANLCRVVEVKMRNKSRDKQFDRVDRIYIGTDSIIRHLDAFNIDGNISVTQFVVDLPDGYVESYEVC